MAVPSHTRLVGRDDERAQLRAALRQAMNGVGTLALVSGEAGIGKSALIEDLKQEALRRGTLVLAGGCYDMTTTAPYGPWIEAARRLQHGAADSSLSWITDGSGDLKGDQRAVFNDMLTTLRERSRDGPLAVVLEDLHWADQASLDALRYITRSTRDVPIVVAVTYRDDELSLTHPLFEALPAIIRESDPLRIELGPLSIDDVGSLVAPLELTVRDTEELASYLYRRAQGNPLFTHELLRSLVAERVLSEGEAGLELGNLDSLQVPPLVVQLIERRLSRMNHDARGLLEIAAVIGQDVDVGFWSEVAGGSNQHLEVAVSQALALHVLEEAAGWLTFTHALVRETLYNGIILPRRRQHHRLIAEALAGEQWADPDSVADHFLRAGDERALPWVLRAGTRAWQAAAWTSAADRFVQAADLLSSDDSRKSERGWLQLHAGSLLRYGDSRRSFELIRQTVALAKGAEDRQLIAETLFHLGVARCYLGEIGQGVDDILSATRMMSELPSNPSEADADDRAATVIRSLISGEPSPVEQREANPVSEEIDPRLLSMLGVQFHWMAQSGRFTDALAIGEKWADDDAALMASGYQNTSNPRGGYHGLGLSYQIRGQADRAEAAWRHASQVAGQVGDHVVEAAALGRLLFGVVVPYYADHPARRVRLLNVIRTASQRSEDQAEGPTIAGYCEFYVDLLTGRWDRARAFENRLIASALTIFVNLILPHLGSLDRFQGSAKAAWKRVYELLPEGPATPPGQSYFVTSLAGLRLAAELDLDEENLDAARAWLETHDRWLEWSGAVIGQAEGELGWARYWHLSGHLDRSRRHAKRALALASNPRQPLALVSANRFLGVLDIEQRQFAAARAWLEESLSLARTCETPYEQALTLLELARLEVETSAHDRARSLLGEVLEICQSLHARPVLERVNRLLESLDEGVQRLPDGLTPREVEVLGLIAAGRSNRQMADDLYLSVRTVERHVANIYRKIDAHNRSEATSYAIQRGLVDTSTT